VQKTHSSLLLCYVGHQDKAYHWEERRKLETHPKTGAAQLVEVRELVREITIPTYLAKNVDQLNVSLDQPVAKKPLLFADISDDNLLGYGVPANWGEPSSHKTKHYYKKFTYTR